MARPTPKNPKGEQKSPKFTEATISKLKEAFAIDASVGEACYYANISIDTYYRWIKDNPKLSEEFDRLREKPVLTARQTVVKGLTYDKDFALKYLERKKRREFATRTEVDESGEVTFVFKDNFNKPVKPKEPKDDGES